MATNPWDVQPKVNTDQGKNPWDTQPTVKEMPTKEVLPYAREFAGGFNVGLTKMSGIPVDITNAILSKVGLGSEQPVGGSEWMQKQMSRGGDMFFDRQTEGGFGKIVRRGGEELGGSIVPAGAILKTATKTIPVYKSTEGLIRKVILDPIKRAPGKTSVGELVATTGAGAGAGIAQQTFPESKVAETTGQLVGATAPTALTLTPTGMAVNAAKKVTSRFSKTAQKQAAEKIIKKTLSEELSDRALKSLKQTEALKKKVHKAGVEDWHYTLAEGTESPTLLRQQEHLETNAKERFLDQVTLRREKNQEAIEKYSRTLAPESDYEPQYVINTAKNRVDAIGDRILNGVNRVVQKKQDMINNIPSIDRMGSGKALRDGIHEAKSQASLKMSLMAKDLGISDVNLTEEFKVFQKELFETYKPGSRFEDIGAMPEIYKKIIRDKGENTTFNDIKAIRERISDDIINTQGAATPNRKKLRVLMMMRKDIDNFLDDIGAELGEQYRQFRQAYFDEYITPFESGAVFKAKNKDGTGFYRTSDEKVAELFLDNPSAAKQYYSIFKDDPAMMKNIEAATLDDLKRTVMDDGIINPGKMQAWLKRKGEALEQLPGINEKVSDITQANNALIQREKELVARRHKIENLSLSKQLDKYGKYEITSDKIIDDALQKPGKMAQLNSFIKHDPDALQALKRTVWLKTVQGSSEDVIKNISQNGKSLLILFGKQHLRDMADISQMKYLSELIKPPSGKPLTGNELPEALKRLESITGMKIPQFGTRIYALKSGRVPTSYLALEAMAGTLRQYGIRHSEKIWKEALYDPELSSAIMKGVLDGQLNHKTASRIGGRVFALGLPYIDQEPRVEGGIAP